MDLQFSQSVFSCLQQCAEEYQTQEQTQEVRIPEGLPDIGTVLACWGQVILRGKEWRSDQVGITGGVMAKVLYLPDEGQTVQTVEAWLPFQMKWTIPGGCQDGTLTVIPGLCSADARTLSARKLLVRTNVGVMMQAYCPVRHDLSQPENVPEDVQLLRKTCRFTVLREAGEKMVNLDELLEFPGRENPVEQVIHMSLSPQVLEQKVLSDKLVFRGLCIAHILFRATDGQLQSRDFDIPFSQYGELEGEYSAEAYPVVIPVVTNMELETTPEGAVRLKGGLSGQYAIYDSAEIELTEDAYSPVRNVELSCETVMIPQMKHYSCRTVTVQADTQVDVMRPVDLVFWPTQPYMIREGDDLQAQMGGVFQLLYYDPEGQLQCVHTRWENRYPIPEEEEVSLAVLPGGKTQFTAGMVSMDILALQTAFAPGNVCMLTAVQMGEALQPDPNRPSLVITKAGQRSLWDLAKENGSTPEKICIANALEADPAPDRVLIIPVI